MKSKNDNPLLPLQSVELSDEDKISIWDNAVRAAEDRPVKQSTSKAAPKTKKVTTTILATAAVLALVGFTDPHLLHVGKAFNLLRSKSFSTPEVSRAVSLGYGERINQSVTSNGITLTIGNVYADPTKLVFDMVESFHHREFRKPVIQDKNISLNVNGARQLRGFSGGEFKRVSGGKYAGIVYFPVMNDQPYKPLPSVFTLNVHIHQIGSVKGNWSFSIPVSEQKMQKKTKEYHPNVKVSHNRYSMKISKVSISPVQTIIQSTMTIPANGQLPNQMFLIDNHGQVIGGGIENNKVIQKTQNKRVIQMTIVGTAPPKGATELSLTPLRDISSPTIPLQGSYPKSVTLMPGLHAHITGVDFNAHSTIVHLSMNQAKFKQLTTYKGHSEEGQFFLVSHSTNVGSRSFKFNTPNSNAAQIVFSKVNPKENWGLEESYAQPQSGLVATIPLK